MKLNIDFDADERGVSPVIGVILMVAITVILAAVIGAFVLNLGSNLGQTGPQSQLAASCDGSSMTVSHKGGDKLEKGNVEITSPSSAPTSLSGAAVDDDTLSVGETAYVWNGTSADTDYELTVVHNSSDSVLLDTTVSC